MLLGKTVCLGPLVCGAHVCGRGCAFIRARVPAGVAWKPHGAVRVNRPALLSRFIDRLLCASKVGVSAVRVSGARSMHSQEAQPAHVRLLAGGGYMHPAPQHYGCRVCLFSQGMQACTVTGMLTGVRCVLACTVCCRTRCHAH